jgi:DNA processing protein
MKRSARQILIGLNLIRELTPHRRNLLLDRFRSPQAIWEASEAELAALPGFSEIAKMIGTARREEALDREIEEAKKLGIRIVTLLDSEYPRLLREIENPPLVLYMRGTTEIDTTRTLAIVGTRRTSGYGRGMAKRLAHDLGALGLIVVSGLAVGIDAAAHRGALDAKEQTVAVLGSGFLHPYPASNKRLFDEIGHRGTVVSEYPLDTHPAKWTFPQRNRIIAGLSRGVIVVEAPQRSGALITARLALEEGREVFAIPGNVTSTASTGTNRLIKDGATLVESVEDVLFEFPDLNRLIAPSETKSEAVLTSLTDNQRLVYNLVGLEPLHIDDIISRGKLSPTDAAHILLLLQMENLIQEVDGRRYIRKP